MNEELKPCPFCGSKYVYVHTEDDIFYCECDNSDCYVSFCDNSCDTLDEAIEQWNKRV